MRIAAVVNSLSGGGAERTLQELSYWLAQQGHEVLVITFQESSTLTTPPTGWSHISLSKRSKGLLGLIRTWTRLRRVLAKSRPEIIISFMDQANILTVLSRPRSAQKVIISERVYPEHSSLMESLRSDCAKMLMRHIKNTFYSWADVLVVQTKEVADYFSRLHAVTVSVIPNPITPPLDLGPAVQIKKPAILGIGRLVPQKRFDKLLEAFNQVRQDYPEWNLYIAGDGPLFSSLQGKVRELKMNDCAFLLGRVTNIKSLMTQSDILALTSDFEGFPVVLGEALYAGLATLATDCLTGPRYLLGDSEFGLLVEDHSTEGIAKKIALLMSDREIRVSFAQKGAQRAAEFSLDKIGRYWENLFYL